jgi:cation diffusion facilitator family transporter
VQKLLEEKTSQIQQVARVGFFVNLLLAVFKFVVGIMGLSAAVIADAFHSLSDLATDLMIIIGAQYWYKSADKSHPYGHLRIETLITIVLGFVLFGTGAVIAYSALWGMTNTMTSAPLKIALLGPGATILLKEILYQYTKRTAIKHNSHALLANAWHHRTDALSSIPVIIAVGVASFFPQFAYVDKIGAIIVSLFIIKVAWDIVKPRIFELTDIAAPDKDLHKIKAITACVPGVQSMHAIRTRQHGSGIYVDLHVLVDPEISVKQGHDVATAVKQALLAKNKSIIDVMVHIEPYGDEDLSQIAKI